MHADWIEADWPVPAGIVAGTTLRSWGDADLPPLGRACLLHQVHGNQVVAARQYDAPPDGDATVADELDVYCLIRTADCLPVLLCSQDGKNFAAAHAGWRGLAAGVLENTVAAMDADPSDILVWFGPAISQAAFEVGDEVRDAFLRHSDAADACFHANERGRWQADLYGLARQRLASVGVAGTFGGGLCTYADPERFYSYRRDPDCGRLLSFVGRRKP